MNSIPARPMMAVPGRRWAAWWPGLLLLFISASAVAAEGERVTILHAECWELQPPTAEGVHFTKPRFHEFCAEFGGSFKVHLLGNPSGFTGAQPLAAEIRKGDTIVLRLAHSYQGNFAGMSLCVGTRKVYENTWNRGEEPLNRPYTVTRVARRHYAAGTTVIWDTRLWPGEATFWFLGAYVIRDRAGESPEAEPVPDMEKLELTLKRVLAELSAPARDRIEGVEVRRQAHAHTLAESTDRPPGPGRTEAIRQARKSRDELRRYRDEEETRRARRLLYARYAEAAGLPPLHGLLLQAWIGPEGPPRALVYRVRAGTLSYGEEDQGLAGLATVSIATGVLHQAGCLPDNEKTCIDSLAVTLEELQGADTEDEVARALVRAGYLGGLMRGFPRVANSSGTPEWAARIERQDSLLVLRILLE